MKSFAKRPEKPAQSTVRTKWWSRVGDFLYSTPLVKDVEKLRRNLANLILVRVVVLSVLLGVSTWEALQNPTPQTATTHVIFWVIGFTYAISIVNALWLRKSEEVRELGYLQLAVDTFLATGAVYVTGSSVAIALYLLVICGAALLFSSHGAVIMAVCSAGCYALVALEVLPPLSGEPFAATSAEILTVYFSLVVVALLSGYIARRLEILGSIAEHSVRNLSDLSEAQRQMFDDMNEGIITLDLNSAITNINHAAKAIIGLSDLESKDILGRSLPALFKDRGLAGADELFENIARSQPSEIILRDPSAQANVYLSYSSRKLTDSQGTETGRILVFSDVSLVRDMEERLRLHERMTKLLAEDATGQELGAVVWDDLLMVGESPLMRQIFSLVDRVARSEASVLITGESGTGKELIAKAIHARGERRTRPFVAINCGAIPENLIESELFGHKKGSFTGAINDNVGLFRQAQGGTIFLDEIGELPLHLQTKLLRVLQDKRVRAVGDVHDIPIDVRVVAATNKDLKKEIAGSRFREDLFYRLNVVNIPVPPLRERKEDIPLLVRYFVGRLCNPDQVLPRISPEALQLLMGHTFPGNIRELENIIERSLVLGGQAILPEHLPDELRFKGTNLPTTEKSSRGETEFLILPINLEDELAKLEKHYIFQALEKAGGVKKQAATLLGLNFRSFRYRLKKYGLGGDSQDAQMDDNS